MDKANSIKALIRKEQPPCIVIKWESLIRKIGTLCSVLQKTVEGLFFPLIARL
jgi:hypothetical protein